MSAQTVPWNAHRHLFRRRKRNRSERLNRTNRLRTLAPTSRVPSIHSRLAATSAVHWPVALASAKQWEKRKRLPGLRNPGVRSTNERRSVFFRVGISSPVLTAESTSDHRTRTRPCPPSRQCYDAWNASLTGMFGVPSRPGPVEPPGTWRRQHDASATRSGGSREAAFEDAVNAPVGDASQEPQWRRRPPFETRR